MKVYLSGAITGNDNWREEFELAHHRVARAGFAVINPALIGDQLEKALGRRPDYTEYMRADLVQLMQCDLIFFVNYWRDSRGAKIEAEVAAACGIDELTREELGAKEERIKKQMQEQEEVK